MPGTPPDLIAIRNLAQFVSSPGRENELQQLRKDLCNKDGFQAAFEEAKKTYPAELGNIELDADQRAFCEGWAYLAKNWLPGGEHTFDKALLAAIRSHTSSSDIEGLSG